MLKESTITDIGSWPLKTWCSFFDGILMIFKKDSFHLNTKITSTLIVFHYFLLFGWMFLVASLNTKSSLCWEFSLTHQHCYLHEERKMFHTTILHSAVCTSSKDKI